MLAAASYESLRKMVQILGGFGSVLQVVLQVEALFPGWEVDPRVFTADVDAEVGLITCVWMSCSQRAKLSILLAECTGVWSDSSQRLWRRWWWSRRESRQGRNTKERHDVRMDNILLRCA